MVQMWAYQIESIKKLAFKKLAGKNSSKDSLTEVAETVRWGGSSVVDLNNRVHLRNILNKTNSLLGEDH